MSPKAKHVLARDHLDLAIQELEGEPSRARRYAIPHAAEAAVDSLADRHDIATSPTHWRRAEILRELHDQGVLEGDDGDLLRSLNDERKAYAYDGDDPDFDGQDVDEIVSRVARLVTAAEEAWPGD